MFSFLYSVVVLSLKVEAHNYLRCFVLMLLSEKNKESAVTPSIAFSVSNSSMHDEKEKLTFVSAHLLCWQQEASHLSKQNSIRLSMLAGCRYSSRKECLLPSTEYHILWNCCWLHSQLGPSVVVRPQSP